MFGLAMLRSFNSTEMIGIWFMIAVTSVLVSWLFDWLMLKSGIGLVAGVAATALSIIAGLHLAEAFILWNWRREPISIDVPVVVGIVVGVTVIVVLGLSILKRKFFDN